MAVEVVQGQDNFSIPFVKSRRIRIVRILRKVSYVLLLHKKIVYCQQQAKRLALKDYLTES